MALDLDFGVRGSAAERGGTPSRPEAGSRLGRLRARDIVAIATVVFAAAVVSSLAVLLYLAQPDLVIR